MTATATSYPTYAATEAVGDDTTVTYTFNGLSLSTVEIETAVTGGSTTTETATLLTDYISDPAYASVTYDLTNNLALYVNSHPDGSFVNYRLGSLSSGFTMNSYTGYISNFFDTSSLSLMIDTGTSSESLSRSLDGDPTTLYADIAAGDLTAISSMYGQFRFAFDVVDVYNANLII